LVKLECSFRDMLAGRHTNTQTCLSAYSACLHWSGLISTRYYRGTGGLPSASEKINESFVKIIIAAWRSVVVLELLYAGPGYYAY